MLKRLITIICGAILCLLSACTIVQRLDIQQGNVVDDSMLKQLQPGMSKRQVLFVMGTPLLTDPFHRDRWDYKYYLSKDAKVVSHYRVTLYFNDQGTLSRIEKDMKGKTNTTASLPDSQPLPSSPRRAPPGATMPRP